jgi:hydrogenase maturation protease
VSGLLVIGIGNPDCGDDAIGPMVARLLARRIGSRAEVIERSGDMLALIEDWAGRDGVVMVDAAAPVTALGTIHRIDLLRDALPAGLSRASTHAFGVADAVALAGALDRLPARLIVYAVEGGSFDVGAAPSPAVAAAAEAVAARVAAELCRMTAELPADATPLPRPMPALGKASAS